MQLTVILLACATAAQAAFTSTLVEQTRPAVAEALFRIRLVTSSHGRKGSDVESQIVGALENHVTNILDQVDSVIQIGFQIATEVVDQIHSAQSALIGLGSDIAANGQTILGNLLNGIFGIFKPAQNKFVSSVVDFVSNINIADTLNGLATAAANLISQIDVPTIISIVAGQFIPKPLADLLLNQLGFARDQRNFFSNLWGSVSSGASSAWGALSNGAVNLWGEIVESISTGAANALSTVQQLAMQFANDAFNEANIIISQATGQFMDFLRPYQEDLGVLYHQVANQLGQIVGQK